MIDLLPEPALHATVRTKSGDIWKRTKEGWMVMLTRTVSAGGYVSSVPMPLTWEQLNEQWGPVVRLVPEGTPSPDDLRLRWNYINLRREHTKVLGFIKRALETECADPDCDILGCDGGHDPKRCPATGNVRDGGIATYNGRWTCCNGKYPDHAEAS